MNPNKPADTGTKDFYRGRRVLVLGGAGFIGSHIVDSLLGRGAEVLVIDPCVPFTGGIPENLCQAESRIEWLKAPVEKVDTLGGIFRETGLVIDAMGFTRHHQGLADPKLDLELNYRNHLKLIEALNRAPAPVIYLGSRSQYGKLSGTVDESAPQRPFDPQGVHKTAAEAMFRIYSGKYGWSCLSARIGNCYGPRQLWAGADIGLVATFMRALLEGKEIELYGSPERSRYLIFVRDVAEQLLRLAPLHSSGFTAINLPGERIELKKIVALLIGLNGGGTYRFLPFPAEIAALEPGEVKFSPELLRRYLGEIHYTPLEEALEVTFNDFRSRWKK